MKIMAVDYGAARTGLAVCDRTEFLASPVGTIHERDLAKNMDGSEGEKAQLCEKFAESLKLLVDVPVRLWDERQTTMQAANYLNETNVRGKKRKEVIDEVAATIILESYLAYRRNTASETV